VADTAPPVPHAHSDWLCPAHVSGCGCQDLPGTVCNPYRESGFCPDDIDLAVTP